jgi:hypothetical protein
MAACCGDSYRFPSGDIQTPFRAREDLLLARFLVPQSHFIPPHTASSGQIKPSVVCRNRQFKLLRGRTIVCTWSDRSGRFA